MWLAWTAQGIPARIGVGASKTGLLPENPLGRPKMLVIANGAPKSGSTWLYNILQSIGRFSPAPSEFLLDPENPNSEIVYDRLEEFVQFSEGAATNYLIKNHFGAPEQRDIILDKSNALVVNIRRSLKDAVVSGYYHEMKESGGRFSFESYYWRRGRFLADHIRNYHRTWEERPCSRVLQISYESLKQNPVAETIGLGRFLGLQLTASDAQGTVDTTSMDKLRTKYADDGEIQFFRRGEIGDWQTHFGASQLADIRRIESAGAEAAFSSRRAFVKIMQLLYR